MIKQSTMHSLQINFEIWAEKPKSKTLPVSFADGIGKAKDLNCKTIFLKHWKILKILFLFPLSKIFNDFLIFPWLSNFYQFSMTFQENLFFQDFQWFSMTVGTLLWVPFFLLDLFRISGKTCSATLSEGGMTSKSCTSSWSLVSSFSEEENSRKKQIPN